MLISLLQLAQATSLFGLILLLLGWHAPSLERLPRAVQTIAWGSILGAMGALSVATSIGFHAVARVDARDAMVAVATLFGGAPAGLIAALATAATRYVVGGPLMTVSIVATALTLLAAAAVRWRARSHGEPATAKQLWGLALVTLVVAYLPIFLARDDVFRANAFVAGPIFAATNALGIVLYGTIVRMARQAYLDRHALRIEKHRLEREIADRVVHLEHEIAGRMAAEQSLHEADDALREIVDAMPVGVLVYDRDDRLVIRNRMMQQMYPRQNPETLIGTSRSEGAKALLTMTGQLDGLSPAETVDRIEEWNRLVHLTGHTQVELSLADGRFSRYEAHLRPNGTVVIVHVDISALKRAQAELEAHVHRLQDAVTSRIAAEADLRTAQTRIREIASALPPSTAHP